MRFRDRSDAGRQLVAQLGVYADRSDVLVLAIPRGGVIVGFEVAALLHLPLDVLIVRKIGAEGMPELAVGAIASGGIRLINEDTVRAVGMSNASVNRVVAREQAELKRREFVYRGTRPPLELRGKTVLLVDDGIATGASIRVAIAALRKKGPAGIVVAVPVVDASMVPLLESEADRVVAVSTPAQLGSVGEWYLEFEQILDEQVIETLRRAEATHTDLHKKKTGTLT